MRASLNLLIANQYEVIELLCIDAYSEVYKVFDKNDKKLYALKKIINKNQKSLVDKEVAILEILNENENFLNYYGIIEDKESLYLKLELCIGKSLKSMIEDSGFLDEGIVNRLLEDITKQLEFAHSNNIINNNINPQNIFLHNEKFYLRDWSLSLHGEVHNYDNFLTNDVFLAPEYYNAQVFFKSDIYTLGQVLYYSLHGHLVYDISSNTSDIEKMLFNFTKDIKYKNSLSIKMKNILSQMLCRSVEKRISSKKLSDALKNKKMLEYLKCESLELPDYQLDTNNKILKYLMQKDILLAKYLFAKNLEKNKLYKESLSIYLSLAKQNYTKAMNNIGLLYEENIDIKHNYKLSSYWYFKAGKLGNARAIYNMARIFMDAKGVNKDTKKAEKLFRLAVKKGYFNNKIKEILSLT